MIKIDLSILILPYFSPKIYVFLHANYLATNDLSLTNYHKFTNHFEQRWNIEEFHRGLKQTTGIEKCYSIKADSQKTHIFTAFISFTRLEAVRIAKQISWYEQKASISRFATFNYLNYASA